MNTYPDGALKATNGVGWTVQWVTETGWIDVGAIFLAKSHAEEELCDFKAIWPTEEFRVYEALVTK